jgi:hypothetical protein
LVKNRGRDLKASFPMRISVGSIIVLAIGAIVGAMIAIATLGVLLAKLLTMLGADGTAAEEAATLLLTIVGACAGAYLASFVTAQLHEDESGFDPPPSDDSGPIQPRDRE